MRFTLLLGLLLLEVSRIGIELDTTRLSYYRRFAARLQSSFKRNMPLTRLRSWALTMLLLRFAVFAVGLFLSACGGGYGGSNPTSPTGPNAVLNGSTLATATSHWASSQCKVQVELTGDYGFWSIVVDSSGTTSSGSETWAVGPDANSVTVGPGSGFFWVSALTNITGSTSSQTFNAGVTVDDSSNTHQNLGTCSFALQQGKLP